MPTRQSSADAEPDHEAAAKDAVRDVVRDALSSERKGNNSKKRTATLADLKNKRARKGKAVLTMLDEDGELVELEVQLKAMPGKAYDDLVAEFPPTRKQRDRAYAQGMNPPSFDTENFAPELIARCATDPKMSVEDVRELWASDDWSGGELMGLFIECQRICQGGLEIPFSAAG